MRTLWAMLAVSAVSVFAAPDLRVLEAAKNQDSAALRSLVKQKLDVNAADVDGMTALIWAAHNNDLDSVKALLAAGANAKAANRYEVTALSEAANSGNGPMIEALVKAGADVNAPFGEGETPLREVLLLLKKEKYDFPACIEYVGPAGPEIELARCLQYCKDVLTFA